MRKSWSKGLTKETHPSLRKTSETMKARKVDNFAQWREARRGEHKFGERTQLKQDGDLAELIGVLLGDGHIERFPRTERFRLVSNSNNPKLVERYAKLIEKVFNKKPHVGVRRKENAVDISLYQKHVSERLGIPVGPRKDVINRVPAWILANDEYVVRYLRGLYDAEGSLSIHGPTYTHKLFFSNTNESLLDIVFVLLKRLGFHPHRSPHKVQISKKKEVYAVRDRLRFRCYE